MINEELKEKMRLGRLRAIAEKKALRAKLEEENRNKGLDPVRKVLPPKGEIRDEVVKEIDRAKKKLIRAQIDIATGLSFQDKEGRVYTKVPDGSTGQYLLNQLIGKPKESIEVKSMNLNVDI